MIDLKDFVLNIIKEHYEILEMVKSDNSDKNIINHLYYDIERMKSIPKDEYFFITVTLIDPKIDNIKIMTQIPYPKAHWCNYITTLPHIGDI
jgi:hypothetical protein